MCCYYRLASLPKEQNKTTTLDTSIETSTTAVRTEASQTVVCTMSQPRSRKKQQQKQQRSLPKKHKTKPINEVVPPTSQRRKILAVTRKFKKNGISVLQQRWVWFFPLRVNSFQRQLAQEMGTYVPFGTHNKDAICVLNQHLFGYSSLKEGSHRLSSRMQVQILKRQTIQGARSQKYWWWLSNVTLYPFQNLSLKNGEHNVIGIDRGIDPRREGYFSHLFRLMTQQDPVYGGLKRWRQKSCWKQWRLMRNLIMLLW